MGVFSIAIRMMRVPHRSAHVFSMIHRSLCYVCVSFGSRSFGSSSHPARVFAAHSDFDVYLFSDKFDHNFNDEMFAGSASSAYAARTAAASAPQAAPTGAQGRDKLEAKLLALLMNANVKDSTLELLGDKEVNSMLLFANTGTCKDSFRRFLECDEIGIKGDTLAGMTEQAKLIGVWRALQTVTKIEDKAAAERQQLKLPPTISKKDVEVMRKLFEKSAEGFPVAKHVCPSKPYFQRKIAEMEDGFEAEHLTMVTTDDQDSGDGAGDSLAGFDMALKTFRISQKEMRVSLPTGPEGLRSRIKTLGLASVLLKLKCPNKGVLVTANMHLFNLYTEFLFGPKVWGKATLGLDGKPVATPTSST